MSTFRPSHDCPQPWDGPPVVLPDDAPFDAAAYAAGAEAYDSGRTRQAIRELDTLLLQSGAPPSLIAALRKSFAMGYLAAQKVAAERGPKPVWSG